MAQFVEHKIKTQLTIGDVGIIFRDNIRGRASGLLVGSWSKKLAWQLSTPEEEDDLFAAFEKTDTPAFRVTANHSMTNPRSYSDSVLADYAGWIVLDV